MVGFGFSFRAAKPVEVTLQTGLLSFALSASADEQHYSVRAVRRHVFFVAGTVWCRRSICQVVQRALSLLHTKMH